MPRIMLDTDPGIDDAFALFLALASPEVQLEAITTVSGNVDVDKTTRNALTLLELTGRTDIPVARGCAQPLVREIVNAGHVHGDNGLGGVILPEPRIRPVSPHAVEVIIEKIMAAPGEITLVPIGPLTNVALALRAEPRIAENVREVVIMGGALRVPGNDTPTAEFNIFADPHAAHIVLHAGWPIRLVSLDVTTATLLQREQVDMLAQNGSPVTRLMRQMLDHYFDTFGPKYGVTAFQMHDPLCLAAAFRPDFISWEPSYVDVELAGTLTLGETVAYFRRPDSPLPNVLASVGVDAERFIRFYLERIEDTFHG
ncbi:MAG TPA: nucleoside hydrolase [Ktedonobacteraceae bacterium]|nr:nucleoside hydrolase [Ktedonobacteraceae bacterium]